MKPGQGFSRRVTLDNLKSFARLLAQPGQNQRRGAEANVEGGQKDPEAEAAERLFSGNAIGSHHPFKPSPRSGSQKVQPPRDTPIVETVVVPLPAGPPEVLFAEIPRGGARWNQANFNKQDFTGFFRANTRGPLKLWHVGEDGRITAEPDRPGVARKSKNFSIELAAAAGRKYPAQGKPIGVFVPIAPKEFLYMLLFPGSPQYQRARSILANHAEARPGRMRRVRLAGTTAQGEWPESPLWTAYAHRV